MEVTLPGSLALSLANKTSISLPEKGRVKHLYSRQKGQGRENRSHRGSGPSLLRVDPKESNLPPEAKRGKKTEGKHKGGKKSSSNQMAAAVAAAYETRNTAVMRA